jgi:Arc/MetJ-type ribon-helix-helix transcriptional regulator
MTIHLPNDLESSIKAAVSSGQFVSVDEAMAEAAPLLLREIKQTPHATVATNATDASPDPLLGSMPDAADELDDIVADAMKRRREGTWRTISVE